MSGIDELLIGACLQEKQPSSLPWMAEKIETTSVVEVEDIKTGEKMEVGKKSHAQHYSRRDDEIISRQRDDESNAQETITSDDRFIDSDDGNSGKGLTDFEITERSTLQKKVIGVSCRYQAMEHIESAHGSNAKSMTNPAEGFTNKAPRKEHGGTADTSDRACRSRDRRATQFRATYVPERDKHCPERRNKGKSVKCTQKITRSMVEESRTGVIDKSMTSNKQDIVKDETAKRPDITFDDEDRLKEFTAVTNEHVKELIKENVKRAIGGEVEDIGKHALDGTSKAEIKISNKSNSCRNLLKQTTKQSNGDSSKMATCREKMAVDIDAQLDQLLNITADVCPHGQIVNETGIGPNDIEFDLARKSSQYVVDESDVEWNDGRAFTPVATTDDESSRGYTRSKDRKRGRSREKNTRKNRSRRQSSEDQVSVESRCETRENRLRKNDNDDEDIDEIIKFTTEMMDIKQPKLTVKGRGIKTKLKCEEQRGDGRQVDEKLAITEEEIEELNRKSEALFQKRIRELRKPKKKSNVIRIDQESLQRRKRRYKLLPEDNLIDTQDKPRVSPVVLDDDDVYDISPVKNRETVFDTDTDESDKLCLSQNTKHDSLMTKAEPSIGISKVRQVKSVIGDVKDRQHSTDCDKVRSKSNFHRKRERKILGNKRKTRKNKTDKDRVEVHMSDRLKPCDDQQPSTSGIDIISKGETNETPEQEKKHSDHIQTDDVVEISLNNGRGENRSERPLRRSTPYPRREEVQANIVDMIYESDVDSDYSSGSDLVDKNPPVVQSRDFDFPLPVADRNISVYSSEDDHDEVDYDDYDVSDDDTEYSDEGNAGKKGKLRRFFKWLFCCTKPRTED